MKGKVVNKNQILIECNGTMYGPYKMREDYMRFQLTWKELTEQRAELLIDPSTNKELPPLTEILDFKTDDSTATIEY